MPSHNRWNRGWTVVDHGRPTGWGKGHGKQHPQQTAPNGKGKGSGQGGGGSGKQHQGTWLVCTNPNCKTSSGHRSFVFLSQLGCSDVTCKQCGALHDRQWLTSDALVHWDAVAKSRGYDLAAGSVHAAPPPSLKPPEVEEASAHEPSTQQLAEELSRVRGALSAMAAVEGDKLDQNQTAQSYRSRIAELESLTSAAKAVPATTSTLSQ